MSDKKSNEDQRRDEILARMLTTPPKPFTPKIKKAPSKRRKKGN